MRFKTVKKKVWNDVDILNPILKVILLDEESFLPLHIRDSSIEAFLYPTAEHGFPLRLKRVWP